MFVDVPPGIDELSAVFNNQPDEIAAVITESKDEKFLELAEVLCRHNEAVLIVRT
jgi:glutamate-1-semialdehyde aminotransferase